MGRKSDLNTIEKITNQLEKADGAVGQLMEIDKQIDKGGMPSDYKADERAKLCQTADKHYEKAGELASKVSNETREQHKNVDWERLDSFKNIKENSQDMGLRQKELSLVNSTVSASWEIGDNLKQIVNENSKNKGIER